MTESNLRRLQARTSFLEGRMNLLTTAIVNVHNELLLGDQVHDDLWLALRRAQRDVEDAVDRLRREVPA